jgi:hypothetical protein
MCFFVGRMYCPKVTTSTATFRNSRGGDPRSLSTIHDFTDIAIEHTFQGIKDLLLCLAYTKHDTCLCYSNAFTLGVLENAQTLSKCGAPVSHERSKSLDCLDIVSIDVEPRFGYSGDAVEITREIACKSFDEDVRCPTEAEEHEARISTRMSQ